MTITPLAVAHVSRLLDVLLGLPDGAREAWLGRLAAGRPGARADGRPRT